MKFLKNVKTDEFMATVTRTASKYGYKLKKASPTIMIFGAVIVGVAATVSACKATVKAQDILEDHNEMVKAIHETKGAIYLDKNEDLPEGEHNYIFVGRVGQFCPIMPGKGGALLLREAGLTDTGERKYASVTGAKDYRWLESEAVYQLQMQEDIDKRYFNREVDEAVEEISKYGDFNWFVGDDGVAPWTAPDLPWSDAQEEAARNFDVR